MYYSGWVEGALRSSRQALTRRFVDVRAPGASATLGQSLARLYAARTALLPGDGSSNSRGWFDVGVLAGRRHLANEKWCARRAVPCCLPVRCGVAVAPMHGRGTRRYSGRGGRSRSVVGWKVAIRLQRNLGQTSVGAGVQSLRVFWRPTFVILSGCLSAQDFCKAAQVKPTDYPLVPCADADCKA
jgi:hypothetical protein